MRLFYSKTFQSFAEELYQRAIAEIDRYNVRTSPVNVQVKDIMERFYISNIPTLTDGGRSSLALEDEQEREYQENINANYGNINVYATGKYVIDYNGNSDFFEVMPTNFQEVGANASIGRKFLSFKIRTQYVRLDLPENWVQFLKRNALEVREKIQSNLNGLEADLQNLRPEFEAKITAYIENKILKLQKHEEINKNINPF